MNDFHSSHIAAERQRGFRQDADRERMARQARSRARVNRSNDISTRRSGRPLRLSIHSLLDRMGALVA